MTSNAELLARREAAVPRGIASLFPIFPVRASGSEVWDADGKRYVDFAAGIAALNTGHLHAKVVAAVTAQLGLYTHPAFQVMAYEPYVAVCERLNALAPGGIPRRTLLVTTGAEAVENAVKIARAATGRHGVIAFAGAFHGRTLFTLALTGKVSPYKASFGPLPGGVYHVPFPAAYRGISSADSLRALESLFKTDIAPEQVAAIVIEPMQGEGGFHMAPPEFLVELRALCDRHGIQLVADEIQTGFGRTGKMFAMEHSGVVPDLITVAKSLASGLPLAGVIGRAELMNAVVPGGLGGTYAGNPLACAAALAVLDIIEQEGLLGKAQAQGARLMSRLRTLADDPALACIGDVRGVGAMVAIELVKDRATREPAPELAKATSSLALEEGLIILTAGLHGNVLRLLSPLNTPDALIDEGLSSLERALRRATEAA